MPPETPPVVVETKTPTPTLAALSPTPAVAPNQPEARNPDGSLKDGLSAPKTVTDGQTLSTENTSNLSESEKKLAGEEIKPAEAEGEKKPAVEGVPEKYEFKNLPEGVTVPDDTAAMFKEKGLNQEQAQSMVDYYLKKSAEAARQPYDTWQKMNKDWLETIQKDVEYKSDMKGVVTSISRLIDGVTGNDAALNKEFRAGMDLTGAGNHPAFVKFMYRLSQQMNEGSYVKPGGPSPLGQRAPGAGERPSPARALFPGLS